MMWVIGAGLIVLWGILTLFAPKGWAPLLLLSGICVLIIQIAAYRKTKYQRIASRTDTETGRRGDAATR